MKTFRTLFALFVTLFIVSCSAPLSTRFEEYVTQAESNCKYWTEADWELSQEEYNLLLQEYEENYSKLTQEEKDAINRAIGRYNGLLVKQGIESAAGALQELGESIPSLIEGFMSAFSNENKQNQ